MVLGGVKKLVLAVELNHGNAGLSSAIRISQVLLGSKGVNVCYSCGMIHLYSCRFNLCSSSF